MFETLIHPHNIPVKKIKSWVFEDEEGNETEALRGYLAYKEVKDVVNTYFIEEQFFNSLPIRVNETEDLLLKESSTKKSIVLRPLAVSKFRVEPKQTFNTGKEFIEEFAPFKHTNPIGWNIIKMVGITGVTSKIFVGISSPSEFGKCHGKGTKILMANGSIKKVEDIGIGELIMGDDSKPRKVLDTTKGTGRLYLINQWSGEPYIVNDKHILCLRHNCLNNKEVEISVEDYLNKSNYFKHQALGFKKLVIFPSKPINLDPYILGVWLGDGTLKRPEITSADKEVVSELYKFANKNNLKILESGKDEGKAKTYSFSGKVYGKNVLRKTLKEYGLLKKTKKIPKDYLINSKKVRLEVLAGLLDTDGHLCRVHKGITSTFEITQKNKRLAEEITYLARSVGLRANIYLKKVDYKGKKLDFWRVFIGGKLHIIPTRIMRKQAEKRYRMRQSLNTAFKVEPLGVGDYYGFEIDGNGRYLLADFTVTHNSGLFNLIHGLTQKSVVYQPRTEAGVLIKINEDGNIVFDEACDCEKKVKKIIGNFTAKLADNSPTYYNGAIKAKFLKQNYNIINQSETFIYNLYSYYTKPEEDFFDNMFSNNPAIHSRMLKLKFDGNLLEQFNKDFDITQTAKDNQMYYMKINKYILWIKQLRATNSYKRRYNYDSGKVKGRRKLIYDEITWMIDFCSETLEEYIIYVSALDKCIESYKEMVGEQKLIQEEDVK